MASLYFFIYNNYENRRLLLGETIDEYGAIFYEESNNPNFNPNDGITTTYTAGRQNNPYNGKCDYVIYSEDGTNITSRWFIMEQTRTLQGQYTCILKRDILADNWNKILNSDCFIEKATLRDDDSLIYNKEDMSVNQIKQGPDKLIKDETGIPWIVGYFAPGKELTASVDISGKAEYTVANKSDLPYYDYTDDNAFYSQPVGFTYQMGANALDQLGNDRDIPVSFNLYGATGNNQYKNSPEWVKNKGATFPISVKPSYWTSTAGATYYEYNYAKKINDSLTDQDKTQLENLVSSYVDTHTAKETDNFKSIDGNVYFVSSENKYYKARIVTIGIKNTEAFAPGAAVQIFNQYLGDVGFIGTLDGTALKCSVVAQAYSLVYDVISVDKGSVKLTISADTKKLDDAPYSMFAIPYGSIPVWKGSSLYCTTDKDVAMNIATQLTLLNPEGSNGPIYDLQLLPYCPVREAFKTSTGATTAFDISNITVYDITSGEDVKSVCLIANKATFSFSLTNSIPLTNKKIQNQTDLYRLVSPNYNGQFDFNIAMNEGLNGFNIDCTYKPYQPYIQVAPMFAGLYGSDWQDSRGLICGGDFSLPVVTNAWVNYQLQNKNYQAMFDRQIQNMETTNKYNNLQQLIGAVTGAAGTGVAVGTVTGSVGAGLAAGAFSAAGGIADYGINKILQAEAIDYAKDNFGYQLGNIQALPNSLTKISAFVANNKIFPFLEYYTCTDEEKEALAQKIAWNGMTVMKIGKISDYLSNTWQYNTIKDRGYVKAKLIRYKGIGDAHEQASIAEELNKGVYTR